MVHFLRQPDGLSVVHRSFTLSHQRFVFRHRCHCLVNFELSNAFDSPPSPALYCKCHNSSQKAFASQGKQDCLSGHLHNEQVHVQMALHFCPGLQEGGLTSFFQEHLKDPTDGLDSASLKLQFKKAGHRSSAAKSYEIGHLADMKGSEQGGFGPNPPLHTSCQMGALPILAVLTSSVWESREGWNCLNPSSTYSFFLTWQYSVTVLFQYLNEHYVQKYIRK